MSERADTMVRHELWREYSNAQVDLLRVLRNEISSRRWEIMLDIDEAESVVRQLETMTEGSDREDLLSRLAMILNKVHEELARVPEDMIPAF